MSRGAPRMHAHAERGHDLYETPAVAVRALLAVERLPRRIWEPACGPGAIVRVLREAGHDVVASDLVGYGCPESYADIDFLAMRGLPAGVRMIVTNPPFMHASAFVERALDLCPRVAMLLRLNFLAGQRRRTILEGRGLARIHVFRDRLPMMHRDGWAGPRATSQTDFAWMVWDREHSGDPVIRRVSWRDHAQAEDREPAAPVLAAAE